MRWGIFWRPLRFNLDDCGKIVNAAMLLHNFLIDQREDDTAYFQSFSGDGSRLLLGRLVPKELDNLATYVEIKKMVLWFETARN